MVDETFILVFIGFMFGVLIGGLIVGFGILCIIRESGITTSPPQHTAEIHQLFPDPRC